MNQIEKKPFYVTFLVRYDSESDVPGVASNTEILGGKMIGVSFTDMFAELESLTNNSLPSAPKDGLTRYSIDTSPIYPTEEHILFEDPDGEFVYFDDVFPPPPTVPVCSTGREKCDCGMVVGYCQTPGFCPHLDIPLPTQLTENEDA